MKTFLVFLGCSICLCFCNSVTEQSKLMAKNTGSADTDTVNFKTQVQPVLQNNCSPCHFPGGKLYEKLPFDRGETIISHAADILKRMKKENEVILIKKYIAQNKS